MSLAKYLQARLVVLRPEASAYDASRAMQDNHVGAVLVHDGERVTGIVTDRDLAVAVMAADLDPVDTRLEDVMSSPVAVLPASATEADAARIMLAHHVRRIPIVDGPRVVGLVSLDDLLLEQAVDAPTLAAVVRAQLSDPARLKRRGPVGPSDGWGGTDAARERLAQRHTARAQRSYAALIHRAQAAACLTAPERAAAVVEEVLSAIIRRIRPEEARRLLAQIPSLLAERLEAEVEDGADPNVTQHSLEQAIAVRLSVDGQHASQIARAVGGALVQTITAGEVARLRTQLPADMRELLTPSVPN
jgi:CBS domain-containing protein/uncharacterized protein (DUF2267 family)